MKHKVSELEGALLDAAVAKAEGFRVVEQHGERRVVDDAGALVGYLRWPHNPDCLPLAVYAPSVDWEQGGPIVERERITVFAWDAHGRYPSGWWLASTFEQGAYFNPEVSEPDGIGPTPLIAAMRAYVASKLGEEVELP